MDQTGFIALTSEPYLKGHFHGLLVTIIILQDDLIISGPDLFPQKVMIFLG